MQLYLMRHGIAADRAAGGRGADDRERPLTAKGIKRIEKAARGLVSLSLAFDKILTSPLERARHTAKIVAETLHCEDRLEEFQQLSPEHSVQDLITGLAHHGGLKDILLVGHEPLLSRCASFLLSGKAGAEIRFKKGGLCCLEVDGMPPGESAVLLYALTPKQLRRLAR